MDRKKNISIIGGAGHVGFPLGLAFSSKNFTVNLIDKNLNYLKKIHNGNPPFLEEGSEKLLKSVLKKKKIILSSKIEDVKNSKYIIVCIGTPVSKKLTPKLSSFINFFKHLKKHLDKDQVIIIRSSVYPNICQKIYEIIKYKCKNLSYCPERIVQGQAIKELPNLPQLISGFNDYSIQESGKLFKKICKKTIYTRILEAELVKLFSNAYRYIHFSISNQFYMICKKENLDFDKVRHIMRDGYSRNTNIASSGFSAGPCLLKDTMQLASFYNNNLPLGYAAMKVNQGMPKFIIKELEKKYNLRKKTIGLLGLAFKAETDDVRDSLAIELKKILELKKIKTLVSDEYYQDKNNIDKNSLIKKSDIIILSTPHKIYKKLKINKNKVLVDIWGFFDKKKK